MASPPSSNTMNDYGNFIGMVTVDGEFLRVGDSVLKDLVRARVPYKNDTAEELSIKLDNSKNLVSNRQLLEKLADKGSQLKTTIHKLECELNVRKILGENDRPVKSARERLLQTHCNEFGKRRAPNAK